MVDIIKLSDEVAIDLRNRELSFPGLTDHILEKLSQSFKVESRKVAFSPAGSSSGILAGRTGETWAKTFFYRQSNRTQASLKTFTLSSRLANIFESPGYVAHSKYQIMRASRLAFLFSNPEQLIEAEMAAWAADK